MPRNKLTDVRNLLIEQMERLADPDEDVDMERIKQLNQIGKTLVESAKAEALFLGAANEAGFYIKEHSGFINTAENLKEIDK